MSLWSDASQKVEMNDANQMVNTFLTSTNRRVSAMASSDQSIHTGDVTIRGDNNSVTMSQVADVTGTQYVDSLSASQLDVKSSMIASLEASLQNDKGAGGGLTGAASPFVGAGGHLSGLATSARSTLNISKRMDLVTAVSNTLSEAASQNSISKQAIDSGNIFVDGNNNSLDYSQGSAIKQLQDIVSKDERVTKAVSALESKTSAKLTMKNSESGSKMMMIVGMILGFFVLGKAMVGGKSDPSEGCPRDPNGMPHPQCVQQNIASARNQQVFKYIMIFILGLFVLGAIYFIWTKLTGWLTKLL